nr:immunoglobulin light chain junction region [Macaca mulatta]MOV61053.1 immunoglobulin light chain junction region [Macaca mulatta]MOV61096.1 immunoglobulin light chain junction region [Macaca mulatta]MOV61363.1 immunoglobulin light chain junction region [Macaca mulatta]MOV61559.1 immunoglobulin light chain junction region [Macaca mulatta]
CQHHNSYPYSF